MKKLSVHILLICFVFQSTSSLWIITNFYIQRDYIAQNLCIQKEKTDNCCKGICYLTKELKANEQQEQALPDLKQKEIQLFPIIGFEFTLNPFFGLSVEKNLAFVQNFILSDFIHDVFHPPMQA